MQTLTAPKTMLICPKCQKVYSDGAQRFCLSDGARLTPQAAKQDSAPTAGVFSGVLNKKVFFEDKTEIKPLPPPPPQVFKQPLELKAETKKQIIEKPKPETASDFSKIIKPNETSTGQIPPSERKNNPVGRIALAADNPNILLGQTLQGRYFVKSRISQTARDIKYLAIDKSNADRKVVVKIFTGKLDGSDFSAKIFANERFALSRINHPNIANVFDSGALPEGNPFVISEFVKGLSLKEILANEKSFTVLRTARLIRQAADALDAAHRSGVTHRNINPENLILNTGETGTENIKVSDFNIFSAVSRGDFSFLPPEQIGGNFSGFTSDVYSLAAVAYKMLTGALPFPASTSRDLFNLQKNNLQNLPSAFGEHIPTATDEVLRKALAYNFKERFQNIRDFGEAFYKSLASEKAFAEETKTSLIEIESADEDFSVSLDSVLDEPETEIQKPNKPATLVSNENLKQIPTPVLLADEIEEISADENDDSVELELESEKPARIINIHEVELDNMKTVSTQKVETEIPWERRSIEPPSSGGRSLTTYSIIGVIGLFVLTGLIFYYFVNRPGEQKIETVNAENQTTENQTAQNSANQPLVENKNDINEIPPFARTIEQPEGTVYFANTKENLSRELLKNFRGFQLYYPNDWKINKFDKNRNKVDNKFIDISKNNSEGIPIEQFMVSYYDSAGTFELDKENFPAIVEKASEEIKKSPLPNFQMVGSGLVNLNKTDGYDGWKAYEMKFQGEGTALSGDKIKLFGRRFYIPAARPGVKKGLVVTLLATSFSKENASPNDLGTKGDLKTILSTFEPDQNF